MTVQRYRRKPQPSGDGDQMVARYEPGQPLGDLLAVARMYDDEAVVTEVTYKSDMLRSLAGPHLVVLYARVPDNHPAEMDTEVVSPGDYLAYSRRTHSLYATDAADLRQFYDLAGDPS